MTSGPQEERVRHLMMAALDGELSGSDRQELEALLSENAGLQREWEELLRVKDVTSSMSLREPPPEVWEEYWVSIYNRAERRVGWVLASVGSLILVAFGTWNGLMSLLADTALPFVVKLGLFSLVMGGLVLFASVVREKFFMRRADPYKEIQR